MRIRRFISRSPGCNQSFAIKNLRTESKFISNLKSRRLPLIVGAGEIWPSRQSIMRNGNSGGVMVFVKISDSQILTRYPWGERRQRSTCPLPLSIGVSLIFIMKQSSRKAFCFNFCCHRQVEIKLAHHTENSNCRASIHICHAHFTWALGCVNLAPFRSQVLST